MPFWKLPVTALSLHSSFASSKFCSGLVSYDPFSNHFVSFQRMLNGGQFSSACPSFVFQFLVILSHISLEVSSQCCIRVSSFPWSVVDHGEPKMGNSAVCLSWFFWFSFLLILSHIYLYVVLGPGVSSGEFKKFVLEANLEREEAGVHQDSWAYVGCVGQDCRP